MNKKIAEKIKELVDQINQWNNEYFNEENPTVSDRVYDSHLKELVELEKKYPEFVLENSPTKLLGSSTKSKFKKVNHNVQMLSLDKAYDFNELDKFFNDIISVVGNDNIKFLVQPKIDGLSISLRYVNGVLSQAITRGDGQVGEDVTFNVKNVIKDIPTKINYDKDIEIRGEIYISKTNFLEVIKNENTNYANARNLASGTLRQLDQDIVKKRNLSAFFYEIVNAQTHKIFTQEEVLSFLKEHKLPYVKECKIVEFQNKNKIFDFIKEFEIEKRNEIEYEIDGMVIKLNEIQYYEDIGYTSKFPKYSIAYKFDEELTQTILDDIFITVGRTGIVTYNAKLKMVLLKGTMVSAATLHNYNYIEQLGINIGDEVLIKKAGEIIPKVVSLSKKNSKGTFAKILICPYCGSKLLDTKTLNNQICPNYNCPEINVKKIIHFTSKNAMNIDGLGEGIVRHFYNLGFISKIQDIFTLYKLKNEIINEKGFGVKFFENLMEGINNSYKASLDKVIFALGIPQLGSKNAKLIARKIQKLENIFSISIEDLSNIKDIGEVTKTEIQNYLEKKENIDLINFLISININPVFVLNNKKSFTFFKDKTFVISGTFDISRNEIIKIIEDNGGNVSNSISKKTTALILGDNGGSKIEKAKKIGIEIIDKNKFSELIK
ncbi:MAG: NAD-dependent DNA ligase LigA [Mycoplasmataceae bacterium]|nr:NAD-dependent DNA ligase LigA [Mycoplasmataceae bacterium]